MSNWRGRVARRYDDITIPAIRVAFVLSLLIHAAALWTYLPKMKLLTPSDAAEGEAGTPLAVKLANPMPPPGSMPTPPPPDTFVAQRPPQPSRPPAPPPPSRRPPSTPPVMSVPRQSPDAPAVPVNPPAPLQPAPATDLASLVEARRRERGEQPSSTSDSTADAQAAENERQNKIIAANIGMNARPSFGRDARNGGGVFQVKTLEYSTAEFYFFGWDKDISRNSKQVIEVRKGDNSNIRIAVVRRMIEIIREHEQGDFIWESQRLGRQLTLSARARDTTELETFMMQEFFFGTRDQP